ncbi:acyltransferase [Oceanihabitans sediminis]|uniref:acyltransferase n=1 Tax=Oceanihabitans sediminis TaxID=1812012 RepID=UPI00299F184B|nr:acyltransferase [Oceanihabitans sediminis]MDX1774860.1 acyltransferase [Oceanihabitans sediminis]
MIKKTLKKLFKHLFYWSFDTQLNDFKNKGNNIIIAPGLKVTHPHKVKLGNNIYIGPNAFLSSHGNIIIESGVIIGPNITIYSANHNFKNAEAIPYDGKLMLKEVIIKENVWIGGNVIIIPGVTIGEGVVIGAGSVVTKNIPKYSIIGGNPAKIIGMRNEEEYEDLKKSNAIYMLLKKEGKIRYSEIKL